MIYHCLPSWFKICHVLAIIDHYQPVFTSLTIITTITCFFHQTRVLQPLSTTIMNSLLPIMNHDSNMNFHHWACNCEPMLQLSLVIAYYFNNGLPIVELLIDVSPWIIGIPWTLCAIIKSPWLGTNPYSCLSIFVGYCPRWSTTFSHYWPILFCWWLYPLSSMFNHFCLLLVSYHQYQYHD